MPQRPGKTTSWTTTFRLPHPPYCPLCGDKLNPHSWLVVSGLAVCARLDCYGGSVGQQMTTYVLDHPQRYHWTIHRGITWYVPYSPLSDNLGVTREDLKLANMPPR